MTEIHLGTELWPRTGATRTVGQFLTFAASVVMAAPASAVPCSATDEAALSEIKLKQWPGYYRAQDVSGLGDFLVSDFRTVAADGTVTTRAEELTWLARNPWQAEDFSYTISAIACPTPNVAVVIGTGRSVRVDGNGARRTNTYTSSNLLVRVDGRWRAALSHVSGVSSSEDRQAEE